MRPRDCRHASATPRCCLICQVLRRRRPASLLPRGGREGSTIAERLEMVRQALDARLARQAARWPS